MTKQTLDQYINDIKAGLEQALGTTVDCSGRTLELHFTNKNIKLEGKVYVTFSLPGGKINVRITYYNFIGDKKESITLKDVSTAIVCAQTLSFMKAKESAITETNQTIEQFRHDLNTTFTQQGYTRECDSKYMIVFTKSPINVSIRLNDTSLNILITKTVKKSLSKTYSLNCDITTGNTVGNLLQAIKYALEH